MTRFAVKKIVLLYNYKFTICFESKNIVVVVYKSERTEMGFIAFGPSWPS